ncbi:MAG: aminotransferase class I/II-fold pyridoxal phosphate-dependent enzyme [Acidimicrobiales bacterium]|nr:aminotransferase class I/II-fold pyridoxal phosphate-dependent enzyme [Acidimicrobiales bacterium]
MHIAARTSHLKESVIREMTRVALGCGAINLSQGFPDYDPPAEVMEAAAAAIRDGLNQYSMSWGLPLLRERLAERYTAMLGRDIDPDRHVVVTCGVTEAIACAFFAILDPGDEVIVLEPAHETYGPAAAMVGASIVPVVLEAPAFRVDGAALEAAVTPRTRAILVNTPHNPTGRVFDAEELDALTELAVRHDLVVVTDEIYDEILYDGRLHRAPGAVEALRERTITIGGLGKTFAMTGWRLGYAISPDALAIPVRSAHDFLTICAPTPLQAAGAAALALPPAYFEQMRAEYHERRALFCTALDDIGMANQWPEGAYYVMADYRAIRDDLDDLAFARWLTTEVGVACVPGRVFYTDGLRGANLVRFAYAKKPQTLLDAAARLRSALERA